MATSSSSITKEIQWRFRRKGGRRRRREKPGSRCADAVALSRNRSATERIVASVSLGPRKPYKKPSLLPHRLEQYTLRSLAVPLAVEYALPRTEIELPFRNGHDHFVPDRQRTQMRRSVVFARAAIVPVILWRPRRDSLLQPIEDVLPQPGLVIVHEN